MGRRGHARGSNGAVAHRAQIRRGQHLTDDQHAAMAEEERECGGRRLVRAALPPNPHRRHRSSRIPHGHAPVGTALRLLALQP